MSLSVALNKVKIFDLFMQRNLHLFDNVRYVRQELSWEEVIPNEYGFIPKFYYTTKGYELEISLSLSGYPIVELHTENGYDLDIESEYDRYRAHLHEKNFFSTSLHIFLISDLLGLVTWEDYYARILARYNI